MTPATVALMAVVVAASPPVAGRASVVDGDTIDIHGQRIRIYGVDAPESAQTCRLNGKPWRCGQQAANALADRLRNVVVWCRTRGRDHYGRTLATCYGDKTDVGAWMVRNGWALAAVRYSSEYVEEEREAQASRIGIWAGEFLQPWHWRAQRRHGSPVSVTPAPPSAPDACTIKGNITRKGQRIYLMRGQRGYARTRVDRARGERWFCSEAEAKAADWRPAAR